MNNVHPEPPALVIPHVSPAAAHWLLEQFNDDQLFHLLQGIGPFAQNWLRGFQLSRHTCGQSAVRSRIHNTLVRMPQVSDAFLRFPGLPWHAFPAMLAIIEPNWLRRNWRALMRRENGRLLAIAFVLSPTRPMHRRGLRLLRCSTFWETPGLLQAKKPGKPEDVANLLALLFAAKAPPHVPNGEGNGDADNAKAERLEPRTLKELEDARRRADKTKGQLAELKEKQRQELEQAKSERHQLVTELGIAKEAIRQWEATGEERVANAIRQFRHEMLGLTPEFQASVQSALAAEPDLATRAEKLLERQRELNERHAHLQTVRNEIARLRDLAARLDQAAADGADMVPGLAELRAELRTRTDELLHIPGVDSTVDWPPISHALIRRIEASTPDDAGEKELADISRSLEREPLRSLIDPYRCAELQDKITHRRQRLRELRKERELATALDLPQTNAKPLPANAPREIWNPRQILAARPTPAPVTLLVDACNVMHLVPDYEKTMRLQGMAVARRQLVKACACLQGRFQAVELVFDGAITQSLDTRENAPSGVTVVFAAKRAESQNADDCIVRRCNALPAGSEIWLVSDDHGLRQRVASFCCAYLRPADFAAFLAQPR